MSGLLSTNAQLPPSVLSKPERHPEFFHDSVIFLIEDRLYRIGRGLLLQSEFFRDMFELPSTGNVEGNSEDNPICPGGVTTMEVEGLLRVLNTSIASSPPELDVRQLRAILSISTKWSFEDVRNYAISRLDESEISSLNRIEIGLKYTIPRWLAPAYKELCTRSDPLTLDEAQELGIVRYHIISRIREELKPAKANAVQPASGCSSCIQKTVTCHSCRRSVAKFTWKCPIQVDAELRKHKDELGLAFNDASSSSSMSEPGSDSLPESD